MPLACPAPLGRIRLRQPGGCRRPDSGPPHRCACRCRNCWGRACRRCSCRIHARRCLRVGASSLHPFLTPGLMFAARRCARGRFTGNTRFGGGCRFVGGFTLPALSCTRFSCRPAAGLSGGACFRSRGGRGFLGRFSLSTFSWTRLSRCSAGGLIGNACFRGGRRFLVNFSALSCTRLSRSAGLFHRAGLLRSRGLRLRRFRAGLCFSRVGFFSALLLLLW